MSTGGEAYTWFVLKINTAKYKLSTFEAGYIRHGA
jgi:hypothetical protein